MLAIDVNDHDYSGYTINVGGQGEGLYGSRLTVILGTISIGVVPGRITSVNGQLYFLVSGCVNVVVILCHISVVVVAPLFVHEYASGDTSVNCIA